MANPQVPFISAPFKRTEDIDWINPLKRYIAQVYQDDPEKYNEETYTLNRLRQDTRGAGKDVTGRDLLYRYFGQLELLDLRFPVDEKHVKVLFTWYDAFNGRATAQYSLAYEKASVIFNIAATLSAIAAAQNRAEADGRKRAFNFFQAAAGMFQYINDNFLHAPSQDLSRESVKMLAELMLAQAHECFLENSIREKKKEGLIAKLASHAVWTYGNLVDELNDMIGKGHGMEKAWVLICQVKQKYYQALAQQYKAAACEGEAKYGEQVSRLSVAETSAKEGSKLGPTLVNQCLSSLHANSTIPSDSSGALQELCKSLAATCNEKKVKAERDNDMIYHDQVPQESVLTPIDRLNAVKPVSISELYGPNEVNKVIGADIFARLIPLSVHESASMYSEEKAKLVRAESERCDLAKAELNASLDYMKLPGALAKFRQRDNDHAQAAAMLDDFTTVPAEVKSWADQIASEESKNSTTIRELMDTLEGMKSRARGLMDDMSMKLDQEMQQCESMRVKYGDQWQQQPSGQLTNEYRHDIRNHREALQGGAQSDDQLLRRYQAIQQDIAILRQGGQGRELERFFAENMTSLFQDNGQDGKEKDKNSLLDLDLDAGTEAKHASEGKVQRVEAVLEKLRKIENDRKQTLQDLKEKTVQDDISHVLILNKKSNAEQQIFSTELEKFRPHQQRIAATIHQQQQAIQELTAAFKSLMEGEEAQRLQTRWDAADRQRRALMDRLNKAKSSYSEVKDGLSKGVQFYSNLLDVIESLSQNIQRFTQERSREREKMVEDIESTRSAREQEMLREKINRYSGASPSAPPGIPETNPHLSQLADRTRQMSLNDKPPHPPTPSEPTYSTSSRGSYNSGMMTSPVSSQPSPMHHVGYGGYPGSQNQGYGGSTSNPSIPLSQSGYMGYQPYVPSTAPSMPAMYQQPTPTPPQQPQQPPYQANQPPPAAQPIPSMQRPMNAPYPPPPPPSNSYGSIPGAAGYGAPRPNGPPSGHDAYGMGSQGRPSGAAPGPPYGMNMMGSHPPRPMYGQQGPPMQPSPPSTQYRPGAQQPPVPGHPPPPLPQQQQQQQQPPPPATPAKYSMPPSHGGNYYSATSSSSPGTPQYGMPPSPAAGYGYQQIRPAAPQGYQQPMPPPAPQWQQQGPSQPPPPPAPSSNYWNGPNTPGGNSGNSLMD
ncbi:BRO1-like domain-containing protein [Radiomyces spectabilis]|uniref:BRO1-like domain-containing protein n=1 Tax=Radiomyces spectabilis TaxID=64574 RepID=UPI0022205D9D|nr:BRO1-like domain-containing protein [Radiomyces spectabilis]KAI8384504.1 BRO1-like domain-containing protein [Radiomyces spectabilis]